jgi:hypothetical protein
MNEKSSKLRHEQKQESVSEQQQQHKTEAKEFSSVEEALREDATATTVPPAIAARLNESIAREPKPEKSWWKRIFPGK